MKSSRESVQRREDWRERAGEGNVKAHKLQNRIHCTSCWNVSPSNMKPLRGPSTCYVKFLACSSFSQAVSFFQNAILVLPLTSINFIFYPSCRSSSINIFLQLSQHFSLGFQNFPPPSSVQVSECLLHNFSFRAAAVVFLESPGKTKEGRGQ